MGWTQEQNTGAAGRGFRGVWFDNNLFAFVQRSVAGAASGVWYRNGIGPWILTQAGTHPTYWEADGAFYTGGYGVAAERPRVYRSVDGINWVLDWTIPAGWVANPSFIFGMEAYGDYLYCLVTDAGVDTTILRRDRDGVWTDLPTGLAPEVTPESTRGVIEFGGTMYWTDTSFVRYWNGSAWVAEPTLDGQCGSRPWMSVIDNILYIGASSSLPHGGGYFWKTPSATNWSFLSLPIPDNTWGVNTLCLGGDGEVYTLTDDGNDVRIYRRQGPGFALVSFETTGLAFQASAALCVEPDRTIYFEKPIGGTMRFFAFVPDHNLTPAGNGLAPQAMDCDADGNALYLGLYDNAGNPILVRVPLPLTATAIGSLMFDPGAGDAINVKCSEVGQQLAVSGFFGANEQVEVSQDAGLTFADVDPGTWGNERAQPLEVGPEALDDLMICLDNLQDLYDTEDMGTAWTQEQAAIGYSPGAMRRKRDEVVLGDDAANSIEYSPNKGQQLTGITGVFAGNVAALDVA